jgi:hypothetical protein
LQKQALQNPEGFAPPQAEQVGGKSHFSADDPAKITMKIAIVIFAIRP